MKPTVSKKDTCTNNTQKNNPKTQCITLSVCIDKAVHDWLLEQRSNYHLTVNDILSAAMLADLEAKENQ